MILLILNSNNAFSLFSIASIALMTFKDSVVTSVEIQTLYLQILEASSEAILYLLANL